MSFLAQKDIPLASEGRKRALITPLLGECGDQNQRKVPPGSRNSLASMHKLRLYFVDSNNKHASDNNPGTVDLPLKTIQKATDLASAGDVVQVKAGIYRESVLFNKSGRKGACITFEAKPGDKVVIKGSDVHRDWVRSLGQNPVFTIPWPYRYFGYDNPNIPFRERREQIFHNGKLLQQVQEKTQMHEGTFYVDYQTKEMSLNMDFRDLEQRQG